MCNDPQQQNMYYFTTESLQHIYNYRLHIKYFTLIKQNIDDIGHMSFSIMLDRVYHDPTDNLAITQSLDARFWTVHHLLFIYNLKVQFGDQ